MEDRYTKSQRPLLYTIWILLLLFISFCHADIKIGNVWWQHHGGSKPDRYGGGYSHLDLAWNWDVETGYSYILRDWKVAADRLDQYPNRYAGHGGMQCANWVVKNYDPDLFARIKAHSDAGRYEASELNWDEGYLTFGGDEYCLRNNYVSHRFCMDNFGYAPWIAALYDLDSPMWTQPKIMCYVIGKSAENPIPIGFINRNTSNFMGMHQPEYPVNYNNHGPVNVTYKWTSDDGSLVIVGNGGYWGGDGGGAEDAVASAGRFQDFAKRVIAEDQWPTAVTVEWNDHLDSAGSGYSLAFWAFNETSERLVEAEKFASFARTCGYRYPLNGEWYHADIWGGVMQFNMHDIADAQGTPWHSIVSNSTNINMQDCAETALTVADTTLTKALAALSAEVNTSGSGTSVIVYNAMSWMRTDFAMVRTESLGFSNPIHVETSEGTVVPSQVIDLNRENFLVFTADSVPSFGYRAYKVFNTAEAASSATTGKTDGNNYVLDNQYYTVQVNSTNGAVTKIYDKVNAKDLVSSAGQRIASTTNTNGGPLGWDQCCGDWEHYINPMPPNLNYLTSSSVTLVDEGPAVARVRVNYTVNNVSWTHYITLYDRVPVVSNRMYTTNLSRQNELVLNLPLNTAIANNTHTWNTGVAFGHHKYTDLTKVFTRTHYWANVASNAGDYSTALLPYNCSVYSYYGIGGATDLRLIIVAVNPNRYSGNWSKTTWEMGWGVCGHLGEWTDGTPRRGYEFNSPFIAKIETSHDGPLPATYSFLSVGPENIVCTAVKKWEPDNPDRTDSIAMQIRFYETAGEQQTDAVLTLPTSRPATAWESPGNEDYLYSSLPVTVENGRQKIVLPIGHNQIRSIMVRIPVQEVTGIYGPGGSLLTYRNSAVVLACLYNLKGQLLWQGDRRNISKILPRLASNSIFILKYIAHDRKTIVTKRIVQCGAASRYKIE